MKSIQGLVLAIGLGIAGMIFNWMYLNGGPPRDATVAFLGVKEGQSVNHGAILREEQITRYTLPAAWAGNLANIAVQYKDAPTVVGQRVWRNLTGPCLLMTDDLTTPSEELKLDADESVIWIPVDNRTFVSSLLKPGDVVSFMIPHITPTPAMRGGPGRPGIRATPARRARSTSSGRSRFSPSAPGPAVWM